MKFSTRDQERINNFYNSQIKSHGINTPQALSWISDETQKIRFKTLTEIGDLNNKSILDVGCGFGDLYQYLLDHYHGFSYTGIDILLKMVETAKKNFPLTKFIEMNYLQFQPKRFDYIMASGSLSFVVEDYKNVYFSMIKKMYIDSKIGVAFNMLNQSYHKQDETFASYSPSEIKEFCLGLTEKVVLLEDYLQGDFTVYLYH
jgi:trans-aconitate methyltransferase